MIKNIKRAQQQQAKVHVVALNNLHYLKKKKRSQERNSNKKPNKIWLPNLIKFLSNSQSKIPPNIIKAQYFLKISSEQDYCQKL